MRCLKLIIAFDGSSYCGWQRQLTDSTIQSVIEGCLKTMTQESITLHGAGRTDAGVHALGMAASFSTHSAIASHGLLKGLNRLLPRDIRILAVTEERDDFHARFSCVGKEYCYKFSCASIMYPGDRLYMAHFPGDFDQNIAQQCLDLLVGEHDFLSFEAVGSRDRSFDGGRGAVRTIFRAEIKCDPAHESHYAITIAGDGFLRHMVRNIVGTVIRTAQGKRTVNEFAAVFASKDRSCADATAPAHGLILTEVFY
nr:tRNA pseudouridine(38-40) synthase TruA [Desulfobulbaceae bacterium]